MSHQFLVDLKGVFAKHGKPEPADHSAAMLHLLVLQLEGMEALLTTSAELHSKVNSLSDKLAQLEADIGGLIAKVGGSASPAAPGSGAAITQDQLDTMGTVVDGILTRMDTLAKNVVAGVTAAPTPPPPPAPVSPPTAPPVAPPATPLAAAQSPAEAAVAATTAAAAATSSPPAAPTGLGPATPGG